jgi:hypothetical protein
MVGTATGANARSMATSHTLFNHGQFLELARRLRMMAN